MSAERKKHIVLMGKANLGNQMLEYSIENELAIPCNICSQSLYSFPENNNSNFKWFNLNNTDYLFLIDCSNRDIDGTTKEIVINPKISEHNVAFYNLAGYSDSEVKALAKKIRGFFYVHDSMEIFLKGVKAIFKGEVWISRKILLRHVIQHGDDGNETLMVNKNNVDLTQREQQILSLVSVGVSNEEIAERLYISVNTVKTHMYNIFRKIQVSNRLQAALWAAKNL